MRWTSNRLSGGRRARLLGAVITSIALVGLVVVPAQAALDRTLFELDKDAKDDTTTTFFGVLNAAVAAGSAGSTTIQVCQVDAGSAVGFTLLIDAERFEVTATADASGGGCPAVAPNKRDLTVDRAGGSSHSKGENISRIVEAPVDGDDWDQVYAEWFADNDTKCEDLGAVECTFVHDGRAESIFTQSKDYDEIVDWKWRDQSVPDADELDDGFAVKYSNTDQTIFFGADRFATNGSKDAGFWFFHGTVAPVPPVGMGDGTFTGEHTAPVDGDGDGFCNPAAGGTGGPSATPNCTKYDDNDTGGDILILTTFSDGGSTVDIRVIEWIGPGGAVGSLLQRAVAGDCVPGSADQVLCATVNNTTIESPWPYDGKNEPADDEISAGGFLEGGINLSDLGLEGCFSSFMATSRSSPSLNADPKDFILGSFEACDTEVTTTPADGTGTALVDSDDDDSLPEIQIGTGSAGVDVTDQALVDVKGTNDWEGTLDFYLCGPIDDPDLCDTGGVKIGDTLNVSDDDTQPFVSASANLTSVGRYCWRGVFTSATEGVPDATDASEGECFEVTPVTPTLTTQAVDAEGNDQTDPLPFGEPLYDRASLSGTANQPGDNGPGDANGDYTSINATNGAAANGTITFTLIGPDDCETVATGTGTNPETGVAVSGDGAYFSSGFTPDAPGDYHWQASYSGDSPNTNGQSHNLDCSDTNEDVTVQQLQPTMDTEQNFIPNDSAAITVEAGAGDLDGDVTFYLWVDDATCGGDVLATADATFGPFVVSDSTPDGGFLSATVETDNDTAYGDDGTTFHWIAVFESNNGAHLDVTSGCGNEYSSITIENGMTQPAA